MTTQELYLKTIFCCMACDGDIANEEVSLVREMTSDTNLFSELDVENIINEYVEKINASGVKFLTGYLKELALAELHDDEQLVVVDLSVKTIMADNRLEYSEVKFFKKIRSRLTLSDERILETHPDIEDWLLPDIYVAEEPEWDAAIFENIHLDLEKKADH